MQTSPKPKDARKPLREGLQAAGQYGALQTAGRFYPVACVALEITQKCNLDCTLCYLSEHAEQARDVPLVILFQRIAMVHAQYGEGTNIQITGGDPTLRAIEDIEAICKEIKRLNMRSCLMTNGIRATRPRLKRLAAAGLNDVAFHVDLTQERQGYDSEIALNKIREKYIARAQGLGLRILFNTTVYEGNLAEIPALCAFFKGQSRHLALVSFQMQADTGRGTEDKRRTWLTQDVLSKQIGKGFGVAFPSKIGIGHSGCSRYDHLAIAGDTAVSILSDTQLVKRAISALEAADTDEHAVANSRKNWRKAPLHDPGLILHAGKTLLKVLWRLRSGLLSSRRVPSRMSVVLHSFMDAKALEPERCASCVFMVATSQGPVSMCVFNAERDAQLFAPVALEHGTQKLWWSAATGELTENPVEARPEVPKFKNMKGRQRAKAAGQREHST
ncbi:radical SAM protein [Shimia sp.]|uniref:radical SAM protein n=1 Tax=Shimia sp. TaxID=1954381 RepID=UPI003BA8D840